MSRITDESEQILRRVLRMAKLIPNVEQHLLADQADTVAPTAAGTGEGSSNDISDPTGRLVAANALASSAYQERQLWRAIGYVSKALDQAEQDVQRILAGTVDIDDAGIRCPGWNAELRARLGGCGKPIEHWTDAKGVQHNRSTLLCMSCRRAEEAANARKDSAA